MRTFTKSVAISLIFGVLLASVAIAQSNTSANTATAQVPATATFSDQDREAAKKELQKVGELFGVKKNISPPPATKQEAPVTMPEVADKALTMVGNAVGTIAGIVQKVAPEVWEIMVRQQYAKAIAGIIVPSGLILLLWMVTLAVKRFWPCDKTESYFDRNGQFNNRGTRAAWTTLLPVALTAILGVWFFNQLADSALLLINPKYYAVKDLLEMLLK